MKITVYPPDGYAESRVVVELGVERTQRLIDAFSSGEGFREVEGYRVFDGVPEDFWLVVSVPGRGVDMVGIGDLQRSEQEPARAGISLSVSVSAPGLDGLDYTTTPDSIGLDEVLAVAATLRPLLRLAGVLA